MSPSVILAILGGSFLFLLFLGVPVTFVLGGLGLILGILFWSPSCFVMAGRAIFTTMTDQLLLAIPLFVFMGYMTRYSGIGEAFYKAMETWMGRIRGGLAMGSILTMAAIAAMTPSGVGTVLLGSVAYPSMVSRGYDRKLAMGTVIAGGMLGMLIIPSIMIILYSSLVGESPGRMFLGAIIPALILAALWIIQIGIRCNSNPKLGPVTSEEFSWKEKFISLKGIILPVLIIALVLGGIYAGIFTPTEASGVGSVGIVIAAAINRKLNLRNFKAAATDTLRICGMAFWLLVAAKFFGNVFSSCGAQVFVSDALLGLQVSRWFIIIIMWAFFFILCCFVDDYPMMMITAPIFAPIAASLGFDTLWFGVLFIVNMNIAWLSPPYGFNLFYGKVLDPEMPMGDIWLGIIPFIICQFVLIALACVFPQLVLWLPNLVIG
jgi:tripartite ATP-independent transporter DctM subunit